MASILSRPQCVKWATLLLFTRFSNRVSIIKYKQYICPSCRKDIYWLPIMYLTSFFNVVSPTTHSTTSTCQETVKIPFDLRGMPSPSCNINVGDFTMLKNVSCDDANFVITVALEVVVMTTSNDANDYKVGIITTLGRHCYRVHHIKHIYGFVVLCFVVLPHSLWLYHWHHGNQEHALVSVK